MGGIPSSTMQGLKKGTWTEEEDRILFDFVRQHGERDWHSLPQRAGYVLKAPSGILQQSLLRHGKSCRLRWANYLRPGIRRGDFSPEEEETIIRLQASLGNRWATIARHLYRRTDNEIKNYWNTRLKRRVARSCTTITSVDPQTREQNSITPTDYSHAVSTETTEDNVGKSKCTTSSSTTHNLEDNVENLRCPKHNTQNISEQCLNKTTEVTITTSCASTISSTTKIISGFDQANSGSTISHSARVLNKIASNTRLIDFRRIHINDCVSSTANQTTVSPSNVNELMFKRRMELWQSFDREDCDLEEYFFSM